MDIRNKVDQTFPYKKVHVATELELFRHHVHLN